MHKTFVQLVVCGFGAAVLLSTVSALSLTAAVAQGLETPNAPSGTANQRRVIVELSAPPISVVFGGVANAPALQRDLALRVAQVRIALEQALFIARVTDQSIGGVVTGRAQMTVNSVSLLVSAEKLPLIIALPNVKAVHPDLPVERNRP
jgi:hypothetical protein